PLSLSSTLLYCSCAGGIGLAGFVEDAALTGLSSWLIRHLSELKARKTAHDDVLAELRDGVRDQLAHRPLRVLDERLFQQAGVAEKLLHLAIDDLLDHGRWFSRSLDLGPIDAAFRVKDVCGDLLAAHAARVCGSNLHGEVLDERLELRRARHEIRL